jgi:hypothetical protein
MPLNPSSAPRPVALRLASSVTENAPPRLFSRAGVDMAISDPLQLSLVQAHSDLGLGLYQPTPTGASDEVISFFVDEPLQPRRMRQAGRVEFQFLPSIADRKRHGAWRGDWKPMLPPDIDRADRMGDRVELARRSSHRSDVQVGAAIAAANVAEDLRYLIDCGFDYVCLIVDGCYNMLPGHRVALASVSEVIETALQVRATAGSPSFGIRIAAHGSARQVAQWLQAGIDGVGIDGWIQDRTPASETRVESFGGILIDATRTLAGNGSWLYSSVRDFIAELRSEQQFFAG